MLLSREQAMVLTLFAWLWFPTLCFAAEVVETRSPLTIAVMFYSNEVLVVLSIITSLIGAMLVAVVWSPPQDLNTPLNLESKWARFLAGVAGGIAAFFYIMHTSENKLVILQPLWVLGVSFVSPIALQVAYPSMVDVLSRLPQLFTGRNKE